MENNNYHKQAPSVGNSISTGWNKMVGQAFLPLLISVIILGILQGSAAGLNVNFDNDGFNWPFATIFIIPIVILALAYHFLFLPVVQYGQRYLFTKAMRDEEADIKVLFEGFKTKYLNIVLTNLIVHALILIGFVMFIIPGIIIWCRLAFAPYLVMDKNLEPMKAVEKSWELTRGYGWDVFLLAFISFYIYIAGLMVCGVGIIFSFLLVHSAFAVFYLRLLNQKDFDNPIPILGVNEVEE